MMRSRGNKTQLTPYIGKYGYIAGICTGHNAGVCLLKDGEIVFSVEEERLSKVKHDGGPILSMMKILDYTDKLDYLVIANLKVHPDALPSSHIEYSGEELYQGIARRLGLIEYHPGIDVHTNTQSPQVTIMSDNHHQCHSAIAFYNSGFETAVGVIVDSCGSSKLFAQIEHIEGRPENLGDKNVYFETESFFDCSYEKGINAIYRKMQCDNGKSFTIEENYDFGGPPYKLVTDEVAGIGKVWDGVTDYCGFHINECGKTMGLSAYGCENDEMPDLFMKDNTANRDLVKAYYPHRSELNVFKYDFLDDADWERDDLTKSKCRRDMAFKVQKETQEQVLNLIINASEMSGRKNVVLSGGYALNCVSNYYYLDKLKEHDIHLYVEPNSSDAGTATGAALLFYHEQKRRQPRKRIDSLFLGPEYNYSIDDIREKAEKYSARITTECSYKEIAELIKDGNIVSIFQGRSENGPRALGNRSILFNPTIKNGKDIVNTVKGREYFRPFAASILTEHSHDWFDMKGLKESPNMMYAVDVKEDKKDLIPAVLHVDNTCRIQTVSKEVNEHYYNVIGQFWKLTGIPLLFNTSFNLAGNPLVETIDDALKVLNDSDMEYCYMPELSILIKL